MQNIEQFYNLLSSPSQKVLITMHQKPDGDAMGSALGLYHFLNAIGHNAVVISPTNWAGFLNWMPGCDKVIDFEANRDKASNIIKEAQWLFCLDFNVLIRTKSMEPLLAAQHCVKVLIDHHVSPQIDAFDYGISNPGKSSTCEMIYDFIVTSGNSNKLNLSIATCLYTGMMTDTGSFRFPCTTASVHRAIAHLKEIGLEHAVIHDHMFDNFLEDRLRFTGHALLNRMEVLYEYNTAYMSIPKSDLLQFNIRTGDTEGLVNYLLTIQGIKLAAIVIDREEERKWSFRSKDNFDVNMFAREHFEGGGHVNAAGGRSVESLETTTKKFKQVLEQYFTQLQ